MFSLFKVSALNWMKHKDARLGAALAYYSIFSLGPIVMIAITIAGMFFGEEIVRSQVGESIKGLMGETGAQAVNTMLTGANSEAEKGIVPTLIGVGALIFAAVGVVVQLKDALNTVWEVEDTKASGIWHFIRTYILSIAAVIAVGFLLLVSLLLTAVISAMGKYFSHIAPEALMQPIGFLGSFLIIALLFAMMFKWLPDAEVSWRDVWPGALLTALLFEAGKFLIGLYIGKQGLESTFGAAASLVVVLIWVYFSAQIVLMGAEFTRASALRGRPADRTGSGRRRRSGSLDHFHLLNPHQQLFLSETLLQQVAVVAPPLPVDLAQHHLENHQVILVGLRAVSPKAFGGRLHVRGDAAKTLDERLPLPCIETRRKAFSGVVVERQEDLHETHRKIVPGTIVPARRQLCPVQVRRRSGFAVLFLDLPAIRAHQEAPCRCFANGWHRAHFAHRRSALGARFRRRIHAHLGHKAFCRLSLYIRGLSVSGGVGSCRGRSS